MHHTPTDLKSFTTGAITASSDLKSIVLKSLFGFQIPAAYRCFGESRTDVKVANQERSWNELTPSKGMFFIDAPLRSFVEMSLATSGFALSKKRTTCPNKKLFISSSRSTLAYRKMWMCDSDSNFPKTPREKSTSSKLGLFPRVSLTLFWMAYVYYLLFSNYPPGPSVLQPDPSILKEAVDLSLNFWFILPLTFPTQAPVMNPMLEAIFNFVVAWGMLIAGFYSDQKRQRVPFIPFLFGIAFLTNIFYLPYLFLREENKTPYFDHGDEPNLQDSRTKIGDRILSASESKYLPITLSMVAIVSVLWGFLGRIENFGMSAVTRWQDLQSIIMSDRLAHSFAVDMFVFWFFQSALVEDDMARRKYTDSDVLLIARVIPFFGLAYYLYKRPSLVVKKKE